MLCLTLGKAANAWLTLDNIGKFERWCNKYIGHVLLRPHQPAAGSNRAWTDKEVGIFKERCKKHTK